MARTIDLEINAQGTEVSDYEEEVIVKIKGIDSLKLLYMIRAACGRDDFKEFVKAVTDSYAIKEIQDAD